LKVSFCKQQTNKRKQTLKRYVTGDVLPMIQKMVKLTENAITPEAKTAI